MRKLIFFFVLVTALCLSGSAQVAYQTGQYAQSLTAVSTTGAGTQFAMPFTQGMFPTITTWQTVYSGGTPTTTNVNLEGSIDGTNWFVLDTSSSTSNEMRHVVYKPVRFLRCNITSFTSSGTASCGFISGRV